MFPYLAVSACVWALVAWDIGRRYVARIQVPAALAALEARLAAVEAKHTAHVAELMKVKAALPRG